MITAPQSATARAARWSLLLLVLLLPRPARAQVINGVVIEDSTRTPIEAAAVELVTANDDVARRADTDSAGSFRFSGMRAGEYRLRVTHPSYATVLSDTISIGPGEGLALELRMGRQAIPLEPLAVTAHGNARNGGFYQRLLRPGFGRFVTRSAIDSMPGVHQVTSLLRSIPGIQIVPVSRGRTTFTTNMILSRGCEPAIFLDGTPIRQLPESGVDDILQVEAIEGIEVYAGAAGAPMQFSTAGNNCGVVAFWTRSGSPDGPRLTLKRILIGVGVGVAALLGLALLN